LNELTVSSSLLIEIKAGATVGKGNFSGLITVTDAWKEKCARCIFIYDSGGLIPTAGELAGAPVSSLWSLL
jgi:hypothetical protein